MATRDGHIEQQRIAEPKPGLHERLRPLAGRLSPAVLVVGLALGLSSLITYDSSGYGRWMLLLWLAGLIVLAAFFWSVSSALPRIAKIDLVVPAGLVLLFAPLYVVGTYRWPVQVNSDEVSIMTTAKHYAVAPHVDPFGLSDYLGHPTMLFVALGKLGNLLGGVDLFHMRLIHGALGLAVVAASYGLFRQLLPRPWAIGAACLLGANHALFMLSRMAMRENTAVLVEVSALALLLWGLRREHVFVTFLGGVVAGLGFYVYFPARAIFPLWLLFLVGLAIGFRETIPTQKLVRLAAIALVGFLLVAGPVMVAGLKAPPDVNRQQRLAVLVFPEARHLQKDWVFASSETGGIAKNAKFGLSAFNNTVPDHSWNYENRPHGFVDPLSGLLLWVGVVFVGLRIVRRRGNPWPLLALGSFLVLWLAFAFLVNQAPNYPRLLVTLPFVAYLAIEGIRGLAGAFQGQAGAAAALAGALIVIAVAANLAIARDFVQKGRREGEAIGSTGRYVQSHRSVPGERFYLAADDTPQSRYYSWGWPDIWKARLEIFAREGQVGDVIQPASLARFTSSPPFAIFTRRDVLEQAEAELKDRYPQARVRNITTDGQLVVVEVPA